MYTRSLHHSQVAPCPSKQCIANLLCVIDHRRLPHILLSIITLIVSKFIQNKPSGFNDTPESTRHVCIRHKQSSVSLHSKHDHTRVSNRPVPPGPGQPDHRLTKGPVLHHVARPHYRPRTHCSSANSVWVHTPTGHTRARISVVALRNAATLTVPTSSCQLQLSIQANVSTVDLTQCSK